MTETIIKSLEGEEYLDIMYRLPSYAFRPSPPFPDRIEIQETIKRRKGITCFAALENGKVVATAASSPMRQNVRGKILQMGGVFWVVTVPEARRRGLCRKLMIRLFSAVREDGHVVSCLYPFRESFYERMGYVTFPQMKKATFSPSALLPVMNMPHSGSVELMLLSDGIDRYEDFVRNMQSHQHGLAVFQFPERQPRAMNSAWLAVAKDCSGETCGIMTYRLDGDHPTEFTMSVSRFYYLSSGGRYLLLDWIARHSDQARQVEMILPAYELPETWISDLDVRVARYYTPPMGRVLDVLKISGIYAGEGGFTARIIDPMCPWNEGNWKFETADGKMSVTPSRTADYEMTVQGLSALVYGTHDANDLPLRNWCNSKHPMDRPGKVFPNRLPYLHSYF